MAIGDEVFLERLYAAEDRIADQAHGFDDKASYNLIILTFLLQMVDKLHFSHCMLVTWSLVICVSGGLAVAELCSVKHPVEDVTAFEQYREKIIKDNPGISTEELEQAAKQGLLISTKMRIEVTEHIMQRKTRLLVASYVTMVLALAMSIISLGYRG
jgi:hypothetical protein